MSLNFQSRNKKGLAARTLVLLIIGMLILFILLYIVFRSQEGSFEIIEKIKGLFF